MNSLLVFLVRHDNTASLAAHLMAGLAALLLLVGTSRVDAPQPVSRPAVVQVAPARPAKTPAKASDVARVDLPLAAVASAHPVRQ
jgi:hypothetical protein